MAYYSFVVLAKHAVTILDPLILLGEGVNTFTVLVEDLDDLLAQLRDEEVEVKQVNRLDELDSVPPGTVLLPEEDLEALTPPSDK